MTHRSTLLLSAACLAVLTACQADPTTPSGSDPIDLPAFDAGPAESAGPYAAGAGIFNAGVLVEFRFSAAGLPSGDANGTLHFRTAVGGLPIDFQGRVTCLAVDAATHRAWIGGVITRNQSTHPGFTTPIHQVGKDIWFRVVDYKRAQESDQPDRSTFVGFEGGGGIQTSADYCAARIWPGPPGDVQDARTNPLRRGNLTVR